MAWHNGGNWGVNTAAGSEIIFQLRTAVDERNAFSGISAVSWNHTASAPRRCSTDVLNAILQLRTKVEYLIAHGAPNGSAGFLHPTTKATLILDDVFSLAGLSGWCSVSSASRSNVQALDELRAMLDVLVHFKANSSIVPKSHKIRSATRSTLAYPGATQQSTFDAAVAAADTEGVAATEQGLQRAASYAHVNDFPNPSYDLFDVSIATEQVYYVTWQPPAAGELDSAAIVSLTDLCYGPARGDLNYIIQDSFQATNSAGDPVVFDAALGVLESVKFPIDLSLLNDFAADTSTPPAGSHWSMGTFKLTPDIPSSIPWTLTAGKYTWRRNSSVSVAGGIANTVLVTYRLRPGTDLTYG